MDYLFVIVTTFVLFFLIFVAAFLAGRPHKITDALPAEWQKILRGHFPLFSDLSEEARVDLLRLIPEFLRQVRFEGCGGLRLTDEMRVTIAAHAGLLLLGGSRPFYPRLDAVLVYPDSFVVPTAVAVGEGALVATHEVRDGESWQAGLVIVAWSEVLRDLRADSCQNVLIHEFAHQLEEGASQSEFWLAQYTAFCQSIERGEEGVLDEYGTENPHEFFAVASEAFFLFPEDLKVEHAALHAWLTGFYGGGLN